MLVSEQMLGTLAISVAVAAVLVTAWYAIFSRYNRRRSLDILRWLEAALAGQGHVVGIEWLAPSRFHVPLRILSPVFQRASVLVELQPRELPFHWLLSRWRRQQDTLTFQADLDTSPAMNLEVLNHRWCGRTRRRLDPDIRKWHVEQAVPMVLASREDWRRDLGGMSDTLLNGAPREFLRLSVRRRSPQFIATVPLDSIAPGSATCSQLFRVLRELASGASASRL